MKLPEIKDSAKSTENYTYDLSPRDMARYVIDYFRSNNLISKTENINFDTDIINFVIEGETSRVHILACGKGIDTIFRARFSGIDPESKFKRTIKGELGKAIESYMVEVYNKPSISQEKIRQQ